MAPSRGDIGMPVRACFGALGNKELTGRSPGRGLVGRPGLIIAGDTSTRAAPDAGCMSEVVCRCDAMEAIVWFTANRGEVCFDSRLPAPETVLFMVVVASLYGGGTLLF